MRSSTTISLMQLVRHSTQQPILVDDNRKCWNSTANTEVNTDYIVS